MQRVVRSTLVGLLTIAGLAACGDSVTTTTPVPPTPGTVVHSVTVSPSSVALNVGQSVTLAASVDADAGVAARTVTWSSSDATVASVGTDGKVLAIKAGTVTITASSTADATVKGAAVVTVGAGGAGAIPTVTIASINTVQCAPGLGICSSVPANLANFGTASGGTGQLDITLNVDSQGQPLKSVTATLKCGTESISSTQTISSATAPISAEAASAPVTISLNTAALNAAGNGPAIHNASNCQVIASATTNSATPQTASTSTTLTLNNQNTVTVTNAFTSGNTATDANGLTYKSGALTVTATPILYNNAAAVSSVTISLPNAQGLVKTVTVTSATNGVYTATFPNATSGGAAAARIGQLTLTGVCTAANCQNALFDANGFTVPLTPAVFAVDANGNDVTLPVMNAGTTSSFRLDNQAPQAPTFAQIPTRQQGFVNASYVFNGQGTAGGRLGAGATNYQSGGDLGTVAITGQLTPGVGLFASTTTGNASGTTTTFFYKLASAYDRTNDPLQDPVSGFFGTSTASAVNTGNCPTTSAGYTQVTTANDIPSSNSNQTYVLRFVEADKLGNVRCTDLGTGVNTAGFVLGMFGVDKLAPTASFIGSGTDPLALDDKVQYSCYTNGVPQPMAPAQTCALNNNKQIKVALSDDASGFNSAPLLTTVTRLAINNAAGGTGVASTPTDANGFGCPIGFDANGNCSGATTASTIAADPNAAGASSGIDGYYTFTVIARDLARNAAPTLVRTVVVDRQAPTVGGVAVPATVNGGQSASFATSATDNLDLVSADNSLAYNVTPSGSAQALTIRSGQQAIGVAFDNVLTTSASFNMNVPFFIRNVQSTNAAGAPQGGAGTPQSITVRATDAGGNSASSGAIAINGANVPQTNATQFSTNQTNPNQAAPNANGSQFKSFTVTNTAANVSNCPAAGCAGSATAANSSIVTLTAAATGTNSSAGGNVFQFQVPFQQVQFYYQDPTTGEYFFIGSTTAPVVTDAVTGATTADRTFTWSLSFDPPASLGTGSLRVVAIGVNNSGDALVTPVNTATTLTNP
jgi:hypothetical protein